MSYEKQNFEDGAVLKAEHLNHIEDGIETVADNVTDHESRIATLEEGGGSGGDKLYRHTIEVCMDYFDDCHSVGFYLRKYSRSAELMTSNDDPYASLQVIANDLKWAVINYFYLDDDDSCSIAKGVEFNNLPDNAFQCLVKYYNMEDMIWDNFTFICNEDGIGADIYIREEVEEI